MLLSSNEMSKGCTVLGAGSYLNLGLKCTLHLPFGRLVSIIKPLWVVGDRFPVGQVRLARSHRIAQAPGAVRAAIHFQTFSARGTTRSGQMGGAASSLGSPAAGLTTAPLRRATGSPSRIRIWLSGRSAERAGHVQGVAGRYNGGFAAKFICASVSWFMNVIVEVPLVS